MESRTLTWSQSLKITGINLKYKALSLVDESAATEILPDFEQLTLLGEKFSANPTNHKLVNQLIFKRFSTTPWITYRSAFKEIRNSKEESYVTDAGWGCMVRAGQMLIAQILKRHLKYTEKQEIFEILRLFDDCDQEQMFSIQNIVRVASQEHDLEVGEWYNPCQISYIIEELFRSHPINPYRQTLGIVIMNNSSLILEEIVKKMTGKAELCSCKKEAAVCYQCDKRSVSVSVIILSRIGLDAPEPKYLRVLNKMMDSRHFQGLIGGKPGKALFILGRHSSRYIYLDPHMAQPAVTNSNFEKQKQTYFCNHYRSCKNKDIDPSMGISFYLQTLSDIDEFYSHLLAIKKDEPEDFFLFMSLETPDFMKPGYKIDESLFCEMDNQQGLAREEKGEEKSPEEGKGKGEKP